MTVKGSGKIMRSVEYSVWCGGCDALIDFEEFRNQKAAEAFFRKEGWQKTEEGWLCPSCLALRKNQEGAGGTHG